MLWIYKEKKKNVWLFDKKTVILQSKTIKTLYNDVKRTEKIYAR